jgi:rhodanese-related sulfurtransferase
MGPLVPDFIGNEMNFVVAIFIGMAFGYILEQAGFSTSKKLVGLFYGYDFTVLRVFFTAGITAMIGVVALGHFGLLDLNLIFVNPTFLWSALVGGVIMGLGFIIGGFCPGTSVCAAAIGKIDAMIFVLGSFLGVFIFAEGFPFFETLYKAENWGNITIFNAIGTSQGIFAFGMTAMAVGAFWFTTWVEKKVNKGDNPELQPKKLYFGLGVTLLVLGFATIFLPERREALLADATEASSVSQTNSMSVDELAFRLLDKDTKLQIIDLRTAKEYGKFSLPNSVNMTFDELFGKDATKLLTVKHKQTVFVANNEVDEKKAVFIAEKLGFKNCSILEGGLISLKKEILEFAPVSDPKTQQEKDTYKFRQRAVKELPILIQNSKKNSGTKKKSSRVIGGC